MELNQRSDSYSMGLLKNLLFPPTQYDLTGIPVSPSFSPAVIPSPLAPFKPSKTLLIAFIILVAIFISKWSINKYCAKTTATQGAVQSSSYAKDAFKDFVAEVELDLEMGQGEDCPLKLAELHDKINIAIQKSRGDTDKLVHLQSQLPSGGGGVADCSEAMEECRLKLVNTKSWWGQIESSQKFRWFIFAGVLLVTYLSIIYEAYSNPTSESESTENDESLPAQSRQISAAALLLNPSVGGYKEVRGDPDSPSLYKFIDPWEIIVNFLIVTATVFVAWKTVETFKEWGPNRWVAVVIGLVVWVHVLLILYILPFNSFHQRCLYNLRSYAATVLNNPGREMFMAFVFIVLLPLPQWIAPINGATKFEWLAFKLGIFYIVQSVLLGAPHFTVEPYTDEKSTGIPTNELIWYILLIMSLVVMYILSVTTNPCGTD